MAIILFDQFWSGQPIPLIGVGLQGIISKYDLREQVSFQRILDETKLKEKGK